MLLLLHVSTPDGNATSTTKNPHQLSEGLVLVMLLLLHVSTPICRTECYQYDKEGGQLQSESACNVTAVTCK